MNKFLLLTAIMVVATAVAVTFQGPKFKNGQCIELTDVNDRDGVYAQIVETRKESYVVRFMIRGTKVQMLAIVDKAYVNMNFSTTECE